MALSRKVKARIRRNRVKRLYRYPAKVTMIECDTSVRSVLADESRTFLYSSRGPSREPMKVVPWR